MQEQPQKMFRVIDPKNDSDVLGGEVPEGTAQLMSSTPIDTPGKYYADLGVHESAMYRFHMSGSGVYEIVRTK